MKPISFFVRNPAFTLVLVLCCAALGWTAWTSIPRTEDPVLDIPAYQVIVIAPGLDATDLEKLVARPLEDAMQDLDDVEELASTVRDGLVVTGVEFTYGLDTDRKYDDVLRQVAATRGSLPPTVARVEVKRIQTIDVALQQVALVSADVPYSRLQDLAEDLRKAMEVVPGVRRAVKWAYPEKAVVVTLDPDRLRVHGVAAGEILRALEGGNANVPGGAVEVGDRRLTVKTTGVYTDLDEVADTRLRTREGAVLRVRDLGEVAWGTSEPEHIGRFRGERAVFVTALPQQRRSAFEVQKGLDRVLERFAAVLPEGVRLERGFVQAENVEARLGRLEHDFLIAFALVLVTVLPLGLRASLLVLVSIPLSLALGLAAMLWGGQTLNQLSIVGFVIALGLLVDDSIVVVENIARFRRRGAGPAEAAIGATRQIAVAVVGTTVALLFAFLPLMMLPGAAGQFIRPLPLAVVVTVTASLFVALFLIPYLASRVLTGREDPEGNALLRLLQRGIHGTYRPLLHFCMRHRLVTAVGALVLFLASLVLVPVIGFSLFPKAGTPQFLVKVAATEGTGLAATDRLVRRVEAVLATRDDVDWWFANAGRGNPQVYYNETPPETQARIGEVFASWKRGSEEAYARSAEELRAALADIPGALIVVKEFENGPPIDAPIAVRLLGDDLAALTARAAEVEALLAAVPGTRDVNNPVRTPRTDLRVRVDRARADLAGVAELEVDRAVRLAVAGLEAGRFREADGDEYPIRLVLPQPVIPDLSALTRVGVPGPGRELVPLVQVASVELASAPTQVVRFNRERSVTVTAYTREGYNTDRVTREVAARLGTLAWPAGLRWTFGGEVESRQESFGGIGTAVVLSVFGILAVLVLEFRSFRGTVIVASVVPLGLVGGLTALWLTGNTLSFTAAIGFVALTGIEIKNSILLVDFTNQLRARGVSLDAAIEEAGEVRFLPVVLTTLTAVGALLPLALESSGLYSPLAIVIIGGLVSSLVLGRLLTPVMYSLIPPPQPEPEAAA